MSESLILLCKKGDKKAQHQLYDLFADRMFRICYRYLHDKMDAEDILINGFIKIFHHINQLEYRGETEAVAWMKKIMVNECLMFIRSKKKIRFVSDNISEYNNAFIMPEVSLEAEEIYSLILKLPIGYRTVFNLYVVEGYNHREIGEQLGISENTSKSQLHKARILLQELLTKEGIHYEK